MKLNEMITLKNTDYSETMSIRPIYPVHERNTFGLNAFFVQRNGEKVALLYGNEWKGYSSGNKKQVMLSDEPYTNCQGIIDIEDIHKLSKSLRACANVSNELHYVRQRIYFSDGDGKRDYVDIKSLSPIPHESDDVWRTSSLKGIQIHMQQTDENDKYRRIIGWFSPEECYKLADHIDRMLEKL